MNYFIWIGAIHQKKIKGTMTMTSFTIIRVVRIYFVLRYQVNQFLKGPIRQYKNKKIDFSESEESMSSDSDDLDSTPPPKERLSYRWNPSDKKVVDEHFNEFIKKAWAKFPLSKIYFVIIFCLINLFQLTTKFKKS